jgi:hypothetical protein
MGATISSSFEVPKYSKKKYLAFSYEQNPKKESDYRQTSSRQPILQTTDI